MSRLKKKRDRIQISMTVLPETEKTLKHIANGQSMGKATDALSISYKQDAKKLITEID
jgi:hypothetical protein